MANFEMKKVVENQINEILNNEEPNVINGFFVCNIDHFASINGRYGREQANEILEEVDFFVRNFFRGTDIEGRVRGDEYEVLIRKPNSLADIEFICGKFLNTIAQKQFGGVNISMTVGIAVYPFHGTNYKQLKEKASMALVRAKKLGGNTYRIFDAAITKAMYSDFKNNRNLGESDFRKLTEEEWHKYFVDISLRFLYEDTNVFTAMNSILEISCLYYGFDRAFVMLSDTADEHATGITEFYLPGVQRIESEYSEPLRQDLVARLVEEKGDFGIVKIDDSLADEEIREYMKDFGCTEIMFFVNRISDKMTTAIVCEGTNTEVDNIAPEQLPFLAKQILTVWSYIYLVFEYGSAKEILSKVKMFNSMDSDVYFINAKNYYVEYMNIRALDRNPDAVLKKKCYEILHNGKPCEKCPLKEGALENGGDNARIECFDCSSCSWAIHLYSWLDGEAKKDRLLLMSVDMDMVNTMIEDK